ncbi:ABC-three component system protein, partial [Catenulispora subtropica]|uniref:ABC-three component system protein n=1 Tax=Catenulispora subtropica TaxID=450798 RepID=UPI0031CEDEF7
HTEPPDQNLDQKLAKRHWALALLQRRLDKVDVGAAKEMISYIRDQFTAETLPTMVGLADANETELARQYGDSVFVQQMNWIAFPPRNLQKAIVDYYRAYTQAVRWLDEDLIALAELERFEAELVDEWEREFEFMQYGLDDDADEAAKQAAGTNLLRTLLAQTAIIVRPKYNDSFFARGRRHVLADGGRVGWHTDFQERVEQLLHVST